MFTTKRLLQIPSVLLVMVMALSMVILPQSASAATDTNDAPVITAQVGSWSAEYFNNRTFSAPGIVGPAIAGGPLNVNWGLNAPIGGINADGWSARFTTVVNFPVGGAVTFEAKADDTVTVRVDGVAVTASAQYFIDTTYRGAITLTPGYHTIVVEYTDIEREAYVYVSWSGGGTATSPTGVSGTVNAGAGLRFRNGPSLDAAQIATLPFGQSFPISGRSADGLWAYLQYNGVAGWAYASLFSFSGTFASLPVVGGTPTTPTTPSVPGNAVMDAKAIYTMRLRNAPNTTATQVGRIPVNSVVNVYGQSADGLWLRVRFTPVGGAAVDGWTYKQYYRDLNGQALPANLPVVQ